MDLSVKRDLFIGSSAVYHVDHGDPRPAGPRKHQGGVLDHRLWVSGGGVYDPVLEVHNNDCGPIPVHCHLLSHSGASFFSRLLEK